MLTNTCRGVAELPYGDQLFAARRDPLIGEFGDGCAISRRRRASRRDPGRITDLIASGKLF